MAIVPTAVVAFILLALLDGFLIMVGLLGDVKLQIIFMALCLTTTLLAFFLKRPWLVYLAQTFIAGLILFRALQSLQPGNRDVSDDGIIGIIAPVFVIGFGYFLAWLIARAVPSADIS
jgi:hypothetical protein